MLLAILSGPCIAASALSEREEAFQERRSLLLHQIAEEYRPVDYHDRGKYSFPTVIARMTEYGPNDPRAGAYIAEYARGEYDFFHFPFIGLARILGLFPESPFVRQAEPGFLERILLHEEGDHYNALTGEGTENHVSMSRTSGYLFAQEAARIPRLAEEAGRWQELLGEWIRARAQRIYHYGTGEWDSNPYTAYNLIGWLNLHDFAGDPEIRAAARAVLDYHAANMALKMTQGILGGPESRGGTRYGPLSRSATEYIAWIWFGPNELADREAFFKPNEYIQAVHAATSGYRPPAVLSDLFHKEIPTPALYHNTKPEYLLTRRAESHEVFHIGDSFTLGTAQVPHGGWMNTAYGIINWKLVMMDRDGLPAVIMGNGGMKSMTHARGRNPFDQFLQHRSTVVQMTRVPENAEAIQAEVGRIFEAWREDVRADFKERWGREHTFHGKHLSNNGRGALENARFSNVFIPESATVAQSGAKTFLQYGGTYVALLPLSGSAPVYEERRITDSASRGKVSGFVIEVAEGDDYASLDAFMSAFTAARLEPDPDDPLAFRYRSPNGDSLWFRYADRGSWQEMIYDWGSGVTEQQVGFNTEAWQQPDWPSGKDHGRIPILRVNGEPVRYSDSAILSGPFLKLENALLRISDPEGNRYSVDYSEPVPRFAQSRGSAEP
jgi:hypothetical protein